MLINLALVHEVNSEALLRIQRNVRQLLLEYASVSRSFSMFSYVVNICYLIITVVHQSDVAR